MQTSLSLLIVSSENTRRVKLGAPVMRVGRDPSSDILIADPSISRHQFTITLSGEGILVEMSHGSRYKFVKGGRPAMQLTVFPGEFFELGPYKFELEAKAALPEVQAGLLDADPGGPVDLKLANDIVQVAPRWRASASASKEIAAPAEPPSPRWLRVALPAAVLLIGGYLAYDVLSPPPAAPQAEEQATVPDLLADISPIECKGPEVCLARARDLYQIGVQLSDSGSRDLITLYKAAKQLRLANLAVGKKSAGLPDLEKREARARAALDVAFSDLWFRYRRAVAVGSSAGQWNTLHTILSVCSEDRHSFCDNLEHTYQRLGEELEARE